MTKKEILFYIKILEDLNGRREYTDYAKLRMDLLVEFQIKATIDEIKNVLHKQLEQQTLEEEVEDLKMIYNNVS